jgi:putative alpha-1,2-mannosidase
MAYRLFKPLGQPAFQKSHLKTKKGQKNSGIFQIFHLVGVWAAGGFFLRLTSTTANTITTTIIKTKATALNELPPSAPFGMVSMSCSTLKPIFKQQVEKINNRKSGMFSLG